MKSGALKAIYKDLFSHYGPQGWWPGRTRFEVIVGAILTQNTAWTNVERAIANLKAACVLKPERMQEIHTGKIAKLIRPSGYFNQKAKRLKGFTGHLFSEHGGDLSRMFRAETKELRSELLGLNGIGPETADSILLYAAKRPVFVVDAYTKRILARHGLCSDDADYDEMQKIFMDNLPHEEKLFNEYHALIVMAGKEHCRPREPLCNECPLKGQLKKA